MTLTVERRAENEAIFRDANERVAAMRSQLTSVEGKTPFFCECGDASCREIVRLALDEYEAVRAHPARFILLRGHIDSPDELIGEGDTYVIVEKKGAARRVALETDPRGDGA